MPASVLGPNLATFPDLEELCVEMDKQHSPRFLEGALRLSCPIP